MCILLSRQPIIEHDREQLNLLCLMANWLSLAETNSFLAILSGVNFVTITYGIWFYFNRKTPVIALLTLIILGGGKFISFSINKYEDISGKTEGIHTMLFYSEYAISVVMLCWFAFVDFSNSRTTKDKSEAALLAFSSLYVSIPALTSLTIAAAIHAVVISTNDAFPNDFVASFAFLSGATAVIMFLSNLVLALASNPWYAAVVDITLNETERGQGGWMKKLIVTGICASVIGVLAYFAAITVTFVPGVASLYPATAFELAFGSWFGFWGALASFIGLLIAGSVGGWFSIVNGVLLSLSDFIVALAPAIAIKYFGLDPELRSIKDTIIFVAIGLFFGSLPASLLYNYVNLQLGQLSGWNSYWFAVGGWNLGNLIMITIIGIPLMKYGTAYIKKSDIYFKNFF